MSPQSMLAPHHYIDKLVVTHITLQHSVNYGSTARTITQANIDETTNIFTVTGHNMRTGTKLAIHQTEQMLFIVVELLQIVQFLLLKLMRILFIASSLSNASVGTALDITNDGNDSNSFVGDTATSTDISGGRMVLQ